MQSKGLEENKIPAKKVGRVAKNARLELEQKTGKRIVSGNNFKLLSEKKTKKINLCYLPIHQNYIKTHPELIEKFDDPKFEKSFNK